MSFNFFKFFFLNNLNYHDFAESKITRGKKNIFHVENMYSESGHNFTE